MFCGLSLLFAGGCLCLWGGEGEMLASAGVMSVLLEGFGGVGEGL